MRTMLTYMRLNEVFHTLTKKQDIEVVPVEMITENEIQIDLIVMQ